MKNTKRHIEIIGALVCLFFALSGSAQNCDTFLVEAINDQNRIYVTESTDVSKKELRKELNKIQQELLNEMRVLMAEKILTEVKSVTVSAITESGEMHESFYNNETEITSAAILSEGEPEFCVDHKNKRMYGIYSLNRKETASKTLRDCENRLLRLITEVRSESQSSDMVDTRKYNERYEKIKRDARVVVYLDPNADTSFLHEQLQVYSQVFNMFIETSDKDKFKEQYEIVERILYNEDYQTGIRKLRNLMLDFPHETKLSELLSRSEIRYKVSNRNVVGSFEAQGLFAEALNEMYTYCAVISCKVEEYKYIGQLETAYFNSELAGFESAIKQDEKSTATKHITTLKSLAFANPKRYKQAHEAYNIYLVNSEMREVELDLYRKNFHSAFAKVKRIESTYGSNYNSLQSLKRNTAQQLFRSEVILEKQKRQKLFSLGLGAGVFSNNIESVEYIDQQIQTLTWFYSVGLYKKLNYKLDWGAYAKKSDVIGVRFRVFDYKTTTRLQYGGNTEEIKYYRYDTELAVDGTLFRGIHYAFGVIFPDRQIEANPLYTGELGLNIPMHPVSIQINARAVFYNPNPVYTLSGGIYLNLDFWRKFNARDKRKIRTELGLH